MLSLEKLQRDKLWKTQSLPENTALLARVDAFVAKSLCSEGIYLPGLDQPVLNMD